MDKATMGTYLEMLRVVKFVIATKNFCHGGFKFWALIVDNYTDFCWRIFLKNKSELKDKMFTLSLDLKKINLIRVYSQNGSKMN
jgi:hypothetical protein